MRNLKWKNRKLTELGSNLGIYIPKKAKEVMKLKKGMNVNIELPENEDKLIITFPARE